MNDDRLLREQVLGGLERRPVLQQCRSVSTSATAARQDLIAQVGALMDAGGSAAAVVDLVLDLGWRFVPDPETGAERLLGRRGDGRPVPVEIRHRPVLQVR